MVIPGMNGRMRLLDLAFSHKCCFHCCNKCQDDKRGRVRCKNFLLVDKEHTFDRLHENHKQDQDYNSHKVQCSFHSLAKFLRMCHCCKQDEDDRNRRCKNYRALWDLMLGSKENKQVQMFDRHRLHPSHSESLVHPQPASLSLQLPSMQFPSKQLVVKG